MVFSAGIGENCSLLRGLVLEGMQVQVGGWGVKAVREAPEGGRRQSLAVGDYAAPCTYRHQAMEGLVESKEGKTTYALMGK